MKKDDVIALLKKQGVEFDPKTKYNELCKLLKKPEETEDILIKAAKEAGFSEEQIANFDSEESLRNAVNRIKPSILASAGEITPPKPSREPVEMEAKMTDMTLELSPMRAKTALRAYDEQRDIDAFLNRRGIRPKVTRIDISRDYTPQANNKYQTKIVIYYKGPKNG